MKLFSRIGSLVLTLAGVLAFASCQYEKEITHVPQPLPDGESTEISFMAQIPEATVVQTRAETGTVNENRIDDIYVLVFKTSGSKELVYRGKGKELQFSGTANNTVKFKATLPVGEAYDFMVLANAETLLDNNGIVITTPAKTKADVTAILQNAVTTGSSVYQPWSGPIPMWDEQTLTLSTSNSTSQVFNLMRMMARVNVSYEPVSPDNSFKLTQVRYYNYNTAGKLVPDAAKLANLSDPTKGRLVTGVSLPASPNTQLEKYFEYMATDNACENLIYVFEAANQGKYEETDPAKAANWIKNPCLLVKGVYDVNKNGLFDDAETWYRIDFVRKANTTDEEWLSILRNFTYNVVITSVSGQGYPDPDVALKSAPMNLTAGVMDWNDGDMDLIYFDGTAYLSVDKNEFRFERDAVNTKLPSESNVLRIRTDYTVNGYPENSGWKAEYYTDAAGTIPMTAPWLQLVNAEEGVINKGKPTGTPSDDPAEVYFTFSANEETINREAYVFIVAGRLRYRVHVIQRLLSLNIVDPDNSNKAVDSMFFLVQRESASREEEIRHFTVNWTPIADDVTTGNQSPAVWNPFAPEWIKGTPMNTLPAPNAFGSITQDTGTQVYTVTAPAVTDEELNLDPFYERESTYTFRIDNGLPSSNPSYDYVEKSINLHQIYYNIVIDVSKYRLDGGTHTLTVRSNTEWLITDVEEWLYNEDPNAPGATVYPTPIMLNLKAYDNLKEGTTGGPNINGEALAFTTVNNESGPHDGKWGTVWVTFHSPTGKFPDQRVGLPFPAATRLVMGLGDVGDVRSYNIGSGTQYHQNSSFKMLTSPYNFGSMDESVYKVEGLRVIGFNATGKSEAKEPAPNPDYNWHVNSMVNWLNDYSPDVIVVSSGPTSGIEFNANERRLIKEYLENGGSMILCYHGGGSGIAHAEQTAELMELFFGGTFIANQNSSIGDVSNWGTTGRYFKLNGTKGSDDEYKNDPILDGPFGDIRGQYWGAHYHRSTVRTSKISGQATILSSGQEYKSGDGDPNHSVIFRHNKYNLLFIGNGCFMASYYDYYVNSSDDHDPFKTDRNNFFYPIPRSGWNKTENVWNSTLMANAVAWALSTTNHTPPAGKYQNQ